IQPWATALSRQRPQGGGKKKKESKWGGDGARRRTRAAVHRASTHTWPTRTRGGLTKIIQTQAVIVFLFEDLSYRQIFLDGRRMPTDPNPTWMGYSIGHWEDDALVGETSGFNDRTWLDFAGHPHSETLRMTERLRRPAFGKMELQVTL